MEADQLTGIKPSLKGGVFNSFLPTEEAGSAQMSSPQSYQHAKMRSYTLRELLNALVTLTQIYQFRRRWLVPLDCRRRFHIDS